MDNNIYDSNTGKMVEFNNDDVKESIIHVNRYGNPSYMIEFINGDKILCIDEFAIVKSRINVVKKVNSLKELKEELKC